MTEPFPRAPRKLRSVNRWTSSPKSGDELDLASSVLATRTGTADGADHD